MIFGFNTDIKYGDTVYHVQSEARKNDQLLQTQVFVKGRCLGKYASSFAEYVIADDIAEEKLHDLLKAQHKHFVECARAGTIEQEIEKEAPLPSAKASEPPSFEVTPEPRSPEDEPDRISISVDDPDLAAIAEASAEAISERETAKPETTSIDKIEEDVAPPVADADPVLNSFLAELDAAEKEPPPPPLPIYRIDPAGSVIGKGVGVECLEPIVAPDGSSVVLSVRVEVDMTPATGAQITCRIAVPNAPAAYVYSQTNHDGMADVRIDTAGLNSDTPILIQAAIHDKSASRKFTLKRL